MSAAVRMWQLLVAAVACGSVAGCGSADEAATVSMPAVVTPTTALPCEASTGLALPQGWPAEVPLPPGLVLTRTETRSGGRLILTGRTVGDFHRSVDFFNAELPKAGFTPAHGEIDPLDAESDFTGAKVQGRWTAGQAGDCPDHSRVTVLVLPASGELDGGDPDSS